MSQDWNQSAGGRRNPVRPKRLPSIPAFPRGPKFLDYSSLPKIGGPGDPPPGFLSHSNSAIEWFCYWGLSKVYNNPKDSRKGPFIGAPGVWEYQQPYEGGSTVVGTVLDFVCYPHEATRGRPMAIRLQTEFYHHNVDPRKRAKDIVQKAALSTHYEVIDLPERSFIYDKTGQTIVKLLKHVLAGGAVPDPFAGGRGDIRIRDRTTS